MRPPVRRAVLLFLLLFGLTLSAQPAFFGRPSPLTTTRYGTDSGRPVLRSNGSEAFLFWASENTIRVTRWIEGEVQVGRGVLETDFSGGFDAVWTGKHFLVVSGRMARLVTANGEPSGEPFVITPYYPRAPRLAFNGKVALLLYWDDEATLALPLSPEGTPIGAAQWLADGWSQDYVIASSASGFAAVVGGKLITFDDTGRARSEVPLLAGSLAATIAGDGKRYLLVQRYETYLAAIVAEQDGSMRAPVVIEELPASFTTSVNAAWCGSRWIVVHTIGTNSAALRMNVADLGASGTSVQSLEEGPNDAYYASVVGAGGTPIVAWWTGVRNKPVFTSALPLASHPPAAATFTVNRQVLLATASSADATLVVWKEGVEEAVRIAIRKRDGTWSGRQIATKGRRAAAASDGRQFAVAVYGEVGVSVLHLDAEGFLTGSTPISNVSPEAMVWNGASYIVIGGGRFAAVSPNRTLMQSGTMAFIGYVDVDVAAASDGNGLYASWITTVGENCTCAPIKDGIAGSRFGPRLEAADAAPFQFASRVSDVERPAVAWDGKQYAVVWADDRGLMAAHISNSGASQPVVRGLFNSFAMTLNAIGISGGAAILWHTPISYLHGDPAHRFAILHQDGSLTEPVVLDRNVKTTAPAQLAALPDGGVAYINSSVQDDAPFYGTSRIMITTGSPAPLPDVPVAPRAKGTPSDGILLFEWTAPEQPVSRFRVEYRIENGPWNELGNYPPEHRAISFATRSGTKYAFRVRAWNEAGTGAYSNTVFVNAPRRRAVR